MIRTRFGSHELLHRICGGLEVAADLVERCGQLYRSAGRRPDAEALAMIAQAESLMLRAAEVVGTQIHDERRGPAA